MKRKHTEQKSANRGISFVPKPAYNPLGYVVATNIMRMAQQRRNRER